MSRADYEAIAKIIEEVVGKDTLQGVKLLEGIKFYFENKVEKIQIVNERFPHNKPSYTRTVSLFSQEADKAMGKYTAKLKKEADKLKASGKYCGIKG